jgi:hypothetical protein
MGAFLVPHRIQINYTVYIYICMHIVRTSVAAMAGSLEKMMLCDRSGSALSPQLNSSTKLFVCAEQ